MPGVLSAMPVRLRSLAARPKTLVELAGVLDPLVNRQLSDPPQVCQVRGSRAHFSLRPLHHPLEPLSDLPKLLS
jgi:hypothetical protein